jgi:hypothetical protein
MISWPAGVDGPRLSVETKRLFKRLGIKDASFHSLRHTAASWLVMQGADLYSIGQLLGHKMLKMTKRHAHFSPCYMQATTSHIDERIDKWYRDQLRAEAATAKDMLLRYRTQISESLQQVRELTDNDLGQGPLRALYGGNTERLNIDELRSLTFDDVESALWKDIDEDESRILFKVRCLANVVATPQDSFLTWEPTKFAVGGGKQSGRRASIFDSAPTVQKELPVSLLARPA